MQYKFLADSLKSMGYPMHRKKFVAYMEHLLDLGLVEKTGLYHYPYRIVASGQKLHDLETMFIMLGRTGGMPNHDVTGEHIKRIYEWTHFLPFRLNTAHVSSFAIHFWLSGIVVSFP